MPLEPPNPEGPPPLDAQLAEGPVEPSPMPEPLTDEELEIRFLRRAVLRTQQQGRVLMVLAFMSGAACGALLMVLFAGI